MPLSVTQVSADSSNSYIFEEGGLDVSGGLSESASYIIDHHTLTYDFRDDVASSPTYKEITGHAALQVFCSNGILEPGEECDDGNLIN